MDLLVFTHDWEARQDEMQELYGGGDPLFLQNICKDMCRFDPASGLFLVPTDDN